MNNYKIIFLLLLASTMSFAQPQASDSSKLIDAYQQKEELTKSAKSNILAMKKAADAQVSTNRIPVCCVVVFSISAFTDEVLLSFD